MPSNPSPVVTTPTDSTAAGNAIPPDPLAGVPDLATYVTTDDDEKVAALKLVSDSIAQMRQTASRILIFHPANIAIFVALLAAVLTRIYKTKSDTGIAFTTSAGVVMAGLIFVRWCTGEYLFAAEEYAKRAPEVLEDADVVVTKFGGEIIGAVILGWKGVEPGKGSSSPRDSQRGKRRKWRAEIRGWAVRIRYRGKGVGGDLLEEAVKVAKSKGADSVDLAADHASEYLTHYNPHLHTSLPCKCRARWAENYAYLLRCLLTLANPIQIPNASSGTSTTPPLTRKSGSPTPGFNHIGTPPLRARRDSRSPSLPQ